LSISLIILFCNFVDTLEEALSLIRTSLNSPQMEVEGAHYDENITHLIVVMGASVIYYFDFVIPRCLLLILIFVVIYNYRVI